MLVMFRILLCVLCALLFASVASAATAIKGKVTVDGKEVSAVKVSAYPVSTIDFSGAAPYQSGSTAADGTFTLDLPVGEYYLLARGGMLFGYYGRNPVSVPESGLENINLLLLPEKLPVPQTETTVETGVVGTVSFAGKPLPGAIVTVYPDLSGRLKGLGMGWAAPTDDAGYFEMPLSAGSYYLVVRVRSGGKLAGPLKAGDLFGYLSGNPLSVRVGEVSRVHVPLIEVPEKVQRYAESLFGSTQVSGRVVDTAGEPVADVQVLLYDDQMMLNRPLYVSQKTGADGRYVLSFPEGGVYYLAARSELGGTPAPGELYGRYHGSQDHSFEVKSGNTRDHVDIVVEEVY